MARPDDARKRTWRFRLNESAILEVSAPKGPTEQQVRRRGRVSLILGTLIAALMVAAVAWGDDITNDIDSSVDSTLEVLTLSPTGANDDVGFWVKFANGDGDAQCNVDPGESLTIEVNSSNTAVANVVSPANRQLTFTACASSGSDTVNVRTATIDPVGQGTATVSVRVLTAPAGGGSFVTDTASFTVNVDDPPSVTSTTPSNGDTGVAVSSTITVNFSESVANDNAFSLDCPTGTPVAFTTSASPASSYTLTPSAALPNSTTCTVSVNKNKVSDTDTVDPPDTINAQYSFSFTTAAPAPSDTTAPSVIANVSPAPNAAGWNNSTPVELTWTITDSESATSIVSGCVDESFTSETAGVTRSCTASSAGGTTGPVSVTIKIDTTKPVITGGTGTYVLGSWTNQDVTVSFTCADNAGTANSGIGSSNVAGATLTTSGANQSVTNTGTCTDVAGNVANPATVNDIDIDKVPPTVYCNAASFTLNEPGAQVSATVADTLSEPVNATEYGSADTSSVGLKNVSITGYDNAGNSTTANCSYTVGYQFTGLFAPIDKPNTMNVSKAGQAIPLKWRLTDYFGNPVLGLTAVNVVVGSLSCNASLPADLVEEYAAGASGLQNLGDGYYQFNWKTPTNYANSCKSIGLNLGEGFVRYGLANVNFKK